MRRFSKYRAFTLVEMLLTLSLVGMLSVVLILFSSTSSRFIARNLATNHSHEATRISAQELLRDLRDSASGFRLFNTNGTTFTDITPDATADVDVLTGQFAGTRTNGVRFRQLVAGPLVMTTDTTPTSTTVKFTLPAGAAVPIVGDKLSLPLITREYDITGVSGTSGIITVTLQQPVGYTLTAASPNMITGNVYRRVALSVLNNELRFHPNFNGANRSNYRVIRGGITSPQPFTVLFPASGAETDGLNIRVSMEFTDLGYSNQKFGNGTTTLYTVIPARNQPTVLSSTN
jgi:prepilin-type N-terminal cleavage/methylation domain-containing protein